MIELCPGCGGKFETSNTPGHDYMLSSNGCWATYGELLAREYQDPALFQAAHRYSVDAYALQHPGDTSERRAVQSVWFHFISQHLIWSGQEDPLNTSRPPKGFEEYDWPRLPGKHSPFTTTHLHVMDGPPEEHEARAKEWAKSAYDAWAILIPAAEDIIAARI